MPITWHIGDTRDALATFEPASVDLVLTSPPFLALRSYLPADHPDKHREIGSEPTPGEFVDTLLDVVEACARVLAPHGSLAIELGDTFAGSGGAGGDYGDQGLRDGQPKFDGSGRRNRPADVAAGILAPLKRPGPEGRDSIDGWPLAKSLTMVPELFRVALAYGRNPLTGRQTERWRVRNVVRWVRPNPPVGALGDKYRPATSEMVIVCKARDRWFDLDAVREPYSANSHGRAAKDVGRQPRTAKTAPDGNRASLDDVNNNGAGAPPLDWWNIPPTGYPGAHYATWPEKLCVRPILSMCPERVCTTCGQPSRRIVDAERINGKDDSTRTKDGTIRMGLPPEVGWQYDRTTLGWTDCNHNAWRAGVVLDPFAGSGTTLAVAATLGRDAVGIDLDPRNLDLARDRLGLFAPDVIDHRAPLEPTA